MMRIFLATIGFGVIAFVGSAMAERQGWLPETSTMVERGEAVSMMWLAQNDGDTNRQRCGRRDRPPLSS